MEGNKIKIQTNNLDCTHVLNFGLDPGQTLELIFYRKVLDENGHETDDYLLNGYTVATMDYYIACCIFASIRQCRDYYFMFKEKVALCKALDGSNGRLNWRKELLNCLTTWESKFPERPGRTSGFRVNSLLQLGEKSWKSWFAKFNNSRHFPSFCNESMFC